MVKYIYILHKFYACHLENILHKLYACHLENKNKAEQEQPFNKHIIKEGQIAAAMAAKRKIKTKKKEERVRSKKQSVFEKRTSKSKDRPKQRERGKASYFQDQCQ